MTKKTASHKGNYAVFFEEDDAVFCYWDSVDFKWQELMRVPKSCLDRVGSLLKLSAKAIGV